MKPSCRGVEGQRASEQLHFASMSCCRGFVREVASDQFKSVIKAGLSHAKAIQASLIANHFTQSAHLGIPGEDRCLPGATGKFDRRKMD